MGPQDRSSLRRPRGRRSRSTRASASRSTTKLYPWPQAGRPPLGGKETNMPSIEDELELEIEAERVAALIETEEWKSFAQKFDMADPRNENLWDWLVIARLGRDASVEQR